MCLRLSAMMMATRPRSQHFRLPLPSTLSCSKMLVTSLQSCQLVKSPSEGPTLYSIDKYQKYTLQDIVANFPKTQQLDLVKCKKDLSTRLNRERLDEREYDEYLCVAIIKSIHPACHPVVSEEVPGMKDLSPFITASSTEQRPGVMVYTSSRCDKVVLAIEVQSGSFKETVAKTVVSAIALLRLVRCMDGECKEFVSFTFPRVTGHYCVVQVTVSWMGLWFEYSLKQLQLEEVQSSIAQVCSTVRHPLPSQEAIDSFPYLIKLSDAEMAQNFPPGTHQLKSRYTMVFESNTSQSIIKFFPAPFGNEFSALVGILSKTFEAIDRIIVPRFERMNDRPAIVYKKAHYAPLTDDEASLCLLSFVQSVNESLEVLHRLGFAHNDVYFNNICFNTHGEAVLIDLDHCSHVNSPPPINNEESCMYRYPSDRFTGGQSDYMQLGWMIAWVMDSTATDYHNRTFDDLDAIVNCDEFVKKLIMEGVYDEELLLTSHVNSFSDASVMEILQRRPMAMTDYTTCDK